jgi:hypothetical protein
MLLLNVSGRRLTLCISRGLMLIVLQCQQKRGLYRCNGCELVAKLDPVAKSCYVLMPVPPVKNGDVIKGYSGSGYNIWMHGLAAIEE